MNSRAAKGPRSQFGSREGGGKNPGTHTKLEPKWPRIEKERGHGALTRTLGGRFTNAPPKERGHGALTRALGETVY